MAFIGAAIIGGAIVAPAAIKAGAQSGAAKDAAAAQAASDTEARSFQKSMYDQTRADQQPWRDAGVKALSGLADPNFQKDFSMADYQADPGYAFRMQQGQQALERSAAAKGGLMSGGALKGISRYGQDMASQEYGNAYNRFNQNQNQRFGRLSQIAGMGQGANNIMSGVNQNYGNNMGNLALGAGQNKANSAIAQGNITSGAVDSATKSLGDVAGFGVNAASKAFGM